MASPKEKAFLDRMDVIFLVLSALSFEEGHMPLLVDRIKERWGVDLSGRTLSRLGQVFLGQGWVRSKVERVGRARRMVYSITKSGKVELNRRYRVYWKVGADLVEDDLSVNRFQ